MKLTADAKLPNGRDEVNEFLLGLPSHKHLAPLVHCKEPGCTTLLPQERERHRIITKKGVENVKRICSRCVAEHQAKSSIVEWDRNLEENGE